MKITGRKNIDTTTGSISKNLWFLAWPIMVTNLIQILYNFADTFWVGKLEHGTEGIAAVTITFSIVFVLISLANGLSSAAATLSAQYFGAEEYDRVGEVTGTSLITLCGVTFIIVFTGLTFSTQILELMNTPESVFPYAEQYFRITVWEMVFMFIFVMLNGIMRGIGDTSTSMIIGTLSGILNAVLDPLLMFGIGPFPALGISGAAYATLISRVLAVLCMCFVFFSGKAAMPVHFRHMRFNAHILKQLTNLGIPAATTQVIISMGGILLTSRVNMFGDVAVASHGLGHRLDSLIIMPANGINQAVSAMVGQNLGAGKRERAKQSALYAIKMVFIILLCLSVFLFIFPGFFLKIFSSDEEVIQLGINYIRLLSFGYAFLGCRIVMNGVFEGAGAAFTSMFLSIICLWGFRLPLAYAFSYTSMGIQGVWLGISISFVISAFFMLYWFRKNTWLDKAVARKKVTEKG